MAESIVSDLNKTLAHPYSEILQKSLQDIFFILSGYSKLASSSFEAFFNENLGVITTNSYISYDKLNHAINEYHSSFARYNLLRCVLDIADRSKNDDLAAVIAIFLGYRINKQKIIRDTNLSPLVIIINSYLYN